MMLRIIGDLGPIKPSLTTNSGLATEHGIVEVNSPTIAGNLSPRPGVPQENLPESSGPSLTIHQSGVADRNPKQKRTKGLRANLQTDRILRSRSETSSNNSFQVLSHD